MRCLKVPVGELACGGGRLEHRHSRRPNYNQRLQVCAFIQTANALASPTAGRFSSAAVTLDDGAPLRSPRFASAARLT